MDFETNSSLAQFRDQHRHRRHEEALLRTFPCPWIVSVLSACSGPCCGYGCVSCLGHGRDSCGGLAPGHGPYHGGLAPCHGPYLDLYLCPFPCLDPDSSVGLCRDFCCDFYNSKLFNKQKFQIKPGMSLTLHVLLVTEIKFDKYVH